MNKRTIILVGIIIIVILLLGVLRNLREDREDGNTNKYIFEARNYDFSLEHDGLTRNYRVHVPPYYNKEIPNPVVIYLHGGGGSIQSGINDKVEFYSDKFGFLLVMPEGTGPIKNKLLVWNSGKWNTGECCGNAVANNIDDVGFISKLIDEVEKNYNIDSKRIYATGISNGGMMTYRIACELSDKIAAVAVVASPAIPNNCNPLRKISIMHIQGTTDPCVPYDGSIGVGCIGKPLDPEAVKDQVNFWKKENGCSDNFSQIYYKGNANCISYNNCQNKNEVEFCTIEGGGHTWPSGNQYFPIKTIGSVSYDISFDQIWEFFKNHPMT